MNVPKLRFKEFDGEWTRYYLGENAEIKGRVGWKSLKRNEYIDEGPNMIAGKHINNGTINWEKVDHIPKWRYEESPEIMLENDDVIFSKDGSLGNPAIIRELPGESTINSTMMLVRTGDDIDSEFFYQILLGPQFKRLIYLKVSGSSIPHLFQADMKEFSFLAPLFEEQKKISQFLSVLDKKIQLQQQKIDLLQEQKKGYMQKIFKQEWRFKEFTQQWKTTTIGSLAEISRGASPRPIQDPKWFDGNSNVGWLRISDVTKQNGRIHYLEQKISILGQEKTRVLETPHLLLSIAATVGKPVINYIPTGVHDGFLIFYNPTFNVEFMFQWLEMFRDNWQKYGQPGSQVNLNSELVKNQEISIPVIEEQQKIAEFLTLMDKKIQLQKEKLELLKKQKQGFMQQMFI